MQKKPPIGICPKTIHDDKRFYELCGAICRYYESETPIPLEWITEWNEHVKRRQCQSVAASPAIQRPWISVGMQ